MPALSLPTNPELLNFEDCLNREQLYQQFGSPSAPSIKTEEHGYTMDFPCAKNFFSDRPFFKVLWIITEINTEYGKTKNKRKILRSVSCLNDNSICTCGRDKVIRLYNLQGELEK